MTVNWDGQIRMNPSSSYAMQRLISLYAMQRLISLKDRFEIAFACDTDHERHGIVTRSTGLLPPNHYLWPREGIMICELACFSWL